jgi:hypothetical protein
MAQIAIRKSQNEIYADSEECDSINSNIGTVCAAHVRGILKAVCVNIHNTEQRF